MPPPFTTVILRDLSVHRHIDTFSGSSLSVYQTPSNGIYGLTPGCPGLETCVTSRQFIAQHHYAIFFWKRTFGMLSSELERRISSFLQIWHSDTPNNTVTLYPHQAHVSIILHDAVWPKPTTLRILRAAFSVRECVAVLYDA